MIISCILCCCIKFLINITFAYVRFEKCDLCVYVEFKNDFRNDTLGFTKIKWHNTKGMSQPTVKVREVDKLKVLDGNDTEGMSQPTVKVRKVDKIKVLDGNDTKGMSQPMVKVQKIDDTKGMSKPTVKVREVDGCCPMCLVHKKAGQVLAQVCHSKELSYCFVRKAGNLKQLLKL